MTKAEIIKLAQEAGWTGIYSQWISPTKREHLTVPVTMEQIERFAELVAAAEREACAKVCESLWHIDGQFTADEFAAEVRARGQNGT